MQNEELESFLDSIESLNSQKYKITYHKRVVLELSIWCNWEVPTSFDTVDFAEIHQMGTPLVSCYSTLTAIPGHQEKLVPN